LGGWIEKDLQDPSSWKKIWRN